MTRMGRIITDFISFLRKLKHTVNQVSPLRGFTGNRQSWLGKSRRGDTLLTGCFSFRLRQASLVAQPCI
ncbi:MAG: hypothetical protein LBP72_03755 [Dysgonamonadaceae bacterium]|nr:hypothetical protein [Dysgonamonadaceae bacterium]